MARTKRIRTKRIKKDDSWFRPRYAAYGALTIGAAAALLQGPGEAQYDFDLPAGVTARPEAELSDGTFVGVADTIPSGQLQVTTTVSGGQITQIHVDYPRGERHSRVLNDHAVPQLADEALRNQGTDLAFVSGATNTSRAFTASLQDALNQSAGRELRPVALVGAEPH